MEVIVLASSLTADSEAKGCCPATTGLRHVHRVCPQMMLVSVLEAGFTSLPQVLQVVTSFTFSFCFDCKIHYPPMVRDAKLHPFVQFYRLPRYAPTLLARRRSAQALLSAHHKSACGRRF